MNCNMHVLASLTYHECACVAQSHSLKSSSRRGQCEFLQDFFETASLRLCQPVSCSLVLVWSLLVAMASCSSSVLSNSGMEILQVIKLQFDPSEFGGGRVACSDKLSSSSM